MKKLAILMMLIGVFMSLSSSVYAGNRQINGKIIDAKEKFEIAGATVKIKGTGKGVATDINGNFTLKNVPDDAILVISMIGYKTIEIKAKDFKNGSIIKFEYIGVTITPDTFADLNYTIPKTTGREINLTR